MELLNDSIVVLTSQFAFFLFGWIFFVKMLFKDYELHHRVVQFIFCINFSLSCTMFELIIFEIVDFLDIGSRYFWWYFAIYSMLFMVVILTPFYIIFFVLSSSRLVSVNMRLPLSILVFGLYFYLFWKVSNCLPPTPDSRNLLKCACITVYSLEIPSLSSLHAMAFFP